MEEENACSSLLALTDSVLQLAHQDSWTPLQLQHVSGNQPADVWAETEVAMEQVREMCQCGESPTEAAESPEETEQWEQIMWPVRPLSCTSPPLSFATVEWDVPSPHVTGCGVANQLDARDTSRVDAASLPLHHFQDVDDELVAVDCRAEDEDDEEEEKNWINSPLLDSVLKETANDPEPCDAVDEQGPPTQEKEDSMHELLDALTEVSPAVEVGPEDKCAAALDPAESVGSVDFTDIFEDEDEALSFVHLKLEEEQEELDILLTGQEDSEGELLLPQLQLPPTPPETEEVEEKDQEQKKKKEVEEDKVKEEEKEEKEYKEEEVKEDQVKKEEHQEELKEGQVKEGKEEEEEVKEDQVKEEEKEEEEHKEEVRENKVKGEEKEEKEEHKEEEVKGDQVKEEKDEKGEHQEEELKKGQVKEERKEEKEEHKEEEVKEDQVKEKKEEKEEHKEELKEGQLKEEKKEEEGKDNQVKEEEKEDVEDKVKEEEKEEEEDQNEEQVEQNQVKEEHKEEKEEVEEHREEEEVKAKVQKEEEKKELEGTQVEEKHKEEEDVQSAWRLDSVNCAASAPPTGHATLTGTQPLEFSEEKRRSGAEAPEESCEGLNKESEMYKDAELNADSAADPEVVTQSIDRPTIPDGSGVAIAKDQEMSCVQQQELLEQLQPSDERQRPAGERDSGELSGRLQHLEPSLLTEEEKEEEEHKVAKQGETTRPKGADWPAVERAICAEAEHPTASERQEQTEPAERKEQTGLEVQPAAPQEMDESEVMEQRQQQQQPPAEAAVEHQVAQVDESQEAELPAEVIAGGSDALFPHTLLANGKQLQGPETVAPHVNGAEVDRRSARRLAERLFNLDGIQRVDVVKHVDKDNDFSRAVGEEYLKFFDFTGQTLDRALRSFLKVVVLIGETQERERVLQHFSCRFHQCNPESFASPGPVLALTCALMLLNTDLHGQNVGKSMSSSKFVSNLDGMNEGGNFGKDLLKSLYNSIKSEPLQWAIDEGELMTSMSVDEGPADVVALRSKTNPFQDVPHDKTAVEVKEGLLQRKIHADVDGKRTPWGKRGWKTFNGVLRGMVLYLQKVDYRSDQQVTEEVISVHHSLAERAADYTKKPNVFRLQTADWRVFLIQATCKAEMHSWICRINLISALQSSPPFPAAVGSQRRFSRPILPSSQSAHTLERQLQSYSGMLESFRIDLSHLQSNPPEGKKAKAKELEEHRTRAEYLHHEVCRYENYVQVLEAWKSVKKTDSNRLNEADLCLFDKASCPDSMDGDEEEDEDLKRSHSSPALEVEAVPSSVVKVKRNISERRTYRKPIIPRSKDS